MAEHNLLGISGEQEAVNYLQSKGYQILETNWRWHKAEVDIIAFEKNILVFVEVKTRSYNTIINPEEAVSEKKQNLLIEAAEAYCESNQLQNEIRFDILALVIRDNKTHIKHIEAAF